MTPTPADQPQFRDSKASRTGDEGLGIGLVNNMPDAALRSTERQFRALLTGAAQGIPFHLTLYSLPERPRAEAGWSHVNRYYEDVGNLWVGRLDGLIVTGAEPSTDSLEEEPYWRTLVRLVEWAEDHTTSTIWSCLAAHAAVLHLDGLRRRPFHQKLFGVFDCVKAMDHKIVSGLPASWRVPHSRHNDLPEQALAACGYSILSRSPDVGADIFAKQRRSLFLFAQGHPEYDATVLLREYRRDIARFLSGERESYPVLPQGYFHEETEIALHGFRQRALQLRNIDVLLSFPTTAQTTLEHTWQLPALRIYTNWLRYLSERKTHQEHSGCFAGGGSSHLRVDELETGCSQFGAASSSEAGQRCPGRTLHIAADAAGFVSHAGSARKV